MHSTSLYLLQLVIFYTACVLCKKVKCDTNWFRKSIFQTFQALADHGPRTFSKTRKTKADQSCSVTNNLMSLSFLYSSASSIDLHKEHIEEPLLTFTFKISILGLNQHIVKVNTHFAEHQKTEAQKNVSISYKLLIPP